MCRDAKECATEIPYREMVPDRVQQAPVTPPFLRTGSLPCELRMVARPYVAHTGGYLFFTHGDPPFLINSYLASDSAFHEEKARNDAFTASGSPGSSNLLGRVGSS